MAVCEVIVGCCIDSNGRSKLTIGDTLHHENNRYTEISADVWFLRLLMVLRVEIAY